MNYRKNLPKKTIAAIEKEFAKLDLVPEESIPASMEIVALIPWNISLPAIIDEFSHPVLRARARSSIRDLNFLKVNSLFTSIKKIKSQNYRELEKAIYLVTSMENRNISYQLLHESLNRIAAKVTEQYEFHKNTLDDKLKIHLLVSTINDTGSAELKTSLKVLNRILDTKKGLPVAMGVLYLLVNERLGLPLYGINFPFHFILYYNSPEFQTYIDPFNGGVFLDRTSCDSYLELNGFDPLPDFYTKSSTISILKRIYANMIHYYRKTGNDSLREQLLHQLGLLNKNEPETSA